MNSLFLDEFAAFLTNSGLIFVRDGSVFTVNVGEKTRLTTHIVIQAISIDNLGDDRCDYADITLYEDEWATKGDLLRNRLKANLGLHRSIFARNCYAKVISVLDAKKFLDNNHMLGYTRSCFRYGLYTTKESPGIKSGSLVAVATFSRPRTMNREGTLVESYEWIRYANIAEYRVVGGMGKLMELFISEVNPQEIMSYADIEWGGGNAYHKLGFSMVGRTEPIEFHIKRETLERVSAKTDCDSENYMTLRNKGNLKFVRRT